MSFIKKSPRDSSNFKIELSVDEVASKERTTAIQRLASANQSLAEKHARLHHLLMRKRLLIELVERNKQAELTALHQLQLPTRGHYSASELLQNSLLPKEFALHEASDRQRSKIYIHFWIFPLVRNPSLVLENEGDNCVKIWSQQEIEIHDYYIALLYILTRR